MCRDNMVFIIVAGATASILIAMSTIAHAGDAAKSYAGSYFCKGTASGGIKYNKDTKTWESSRFNADVEQFVVVVNNTGETGIDKLFKLPYNVVTINVKGMGENQPDDITACRNSDFPTATATYTTHIQMTTSYTRCNTFSQEYQFDFDALKFQYTYDGGYMSTGGEPNFDTPMIMVGTCTKIN